ncbi:MAG: EpsG family protein [Bergeyella sp.]
MHLLHPVFLVIFAILLIIFMIGENLNEKNTKYTLWFIAIVMIILAGGRNWVGADYPVYFKMYNLGFPQYTTYEDVFRKATFQPNTMEIEWLFVLLYKVCFDVGLPFFVVTFITAAVAISLLVSSFIKYSPYAAFSLLSYFMATYFFTENGQMRQGLGTAFCVYSIKFIIERKMWKFLLVMFFALGVHKSTVVFIPAYWLVTLNISGIKWVPIIVISIIAAPFEIYSLFGGLITSITPQDVSAAYEGYSSDTYYGEEMKSGLGDLINIFTAVIIIIFDKPAQRKIPYFEYYRNLALFGLCLYYIFRGNTIFATRLPGSYLAFGGYFAIPGVIMAVENSTKQMLKIGFVTYFLLFFYAFSKVNAEKGGFTSDRYDNILW